MVTMEIRLPQDKLASLKTTLSSWRGRKACRKRELPSLFGVPSPAAKAVRAGRSFFRRFIDLSMTAKHPDNFIRRSPKRTLSGGCGTVKHGMGCP